MVTPSLRLLRRVRRRGYGGGYSRGRNENNNEIKWVTTVTSVTSIKEYIYNIGAHMPLYRGLGNPRLRGYAVTGP